MKKILTILFLLPMLLNAQVTTVINFSPDSNFSLVGAYSLKPILVMKDSTSPSSLAYMKLRATGSIWLDILNVFHQTTNVPKYIPILDDSGRLWRATLDSFKISQNNITPTAWTTTYPTKTLGTGWKASTTNNVNYDFTVSITTVASLLGLGGTATQLDTVYVDTSPDSTTWTNYDYLAAGQTATVALTFSLTQVNGGIIHVLVPKGYYIRIRRSGSGSSTLNRTAQTLMKNDDWAWILKGTFAFSIMTMVFMPAWVINRKKAKPTLVRKNEVMRKTA